MNLPKLKRQIKGFNYWLSEKYCGLSGSENNIHTFLFHKLFPDRSHIVPSKGSVSEGFDITQFEYFLKYLSQRNIQFINEWDIIEKKLLPKRHYVYLTFDDGYYNNFAALPLLQKYNAKATFFISTNHIIEGKAFWWDVVFRERTLQDKSATYILEEIKHLLTIKWIEQEKYVMERFGEKAMQPINDLDRPMTVNELTRFSQHPCVSIGNHTHNHLNMAIYSTHELKESVLNAHNFLVECTGKPVSSISYPHGFYNTEVLSLMKQLDYKVGITVNRGKNDAQPTLKNNFNLDLSRVQLSGFHDLNEQLHNVLYDFSFISQLRKFKK